MIFKRRSGTLPLTLATVALAALPAAAQQSNADALIAEGHYLRARPIVAATVQKNPTDVHATVQQSVLAWAFFHFDEAIGIAEKAVGMAPNSGETHTALTNALGAKLINSNAGTFEKMSLARRFRKEADLSIQLDPTSIDALEDAARFYEEAPGMVGGDKGKAQQLAERVDKLDPARGAALKASFLDGDKNSPAHQAEVEGFWKAAIAARPDSADAHAGLARVYFREGGPKLALAEAEDRRAIALKPTQIHPYRQLAILYATAGRWDDLTKLLNQSHAAIPNNLSPDFEAARIILTTNAGPQLAQAEQYLRGYLAQPAEGEAPTHAMAHWRLGLVLEKEGRRNDAIHELETAVHLDGNLDDAKKDLKRLS